MILMPILVHWPEPPKLPPVPYLRITTEMLNDRKAVIARMMLETMDRRRVLRVDDDGVPCLVQAIGYIREDRTYVLALFNAHYVTLTVECVESFICTDERKYREAQDFEPMYPLFEAYANEAIDSIREIWSAVV